MRAEKAREVIAAYLTGQHVEAERVREALDALADDRDYAERFRAETGMDGSWVSDCDVFRSHVAEFAEVPPAGREDRMPALARHLEECPACRRIHDSVRSPWAPDEPGAAPAAARGGTRRAEPSPVAIIDRQGNVFLSDEGLLAQESMEAVVAVQMGLDVVGKRAAEWVLPDDGARCRVSLRVAGEAPGQGRLSCKVEGGPGSELDPEQMRIEVVAADTGELATDLPLVECQIEPIVIGPGSWLVRVRSGPAAGGLTWEIPLDIRLEGEDGNRTGDGD